MKKFILKYWYILPLMLAILMLTLLWLFTKAPTFFEDIVGVLLVPTIVFIVISWVVMIVNKQWWRFIISTSFSKLVDKKEFTIYEGDWEDYYAARIEVWHYDKATGKEKKLVEKIYRVEGWMR